MFEANCRLDVNPAGTAIWNLPTASSNALADGEVKIVLRHAELPTSSPELQKSGIDIHQRRALKVRQQRGTDGIVEIQQQIGACKDCFGIATGDAEELGFR